GLRPEDVPADSGLNEALAEIQIHTRAESAWADASHDITYKAALDLPKPLTRRITRLLALVELFDDQLSVAQHELLALPGFPAARMLVALDRLFLPLGRRDFDRQLSLEVLEHLRPLYTEPEQIGFPQLLGTFVRE